MINIMINEGSIVLRFLRTEQSALGILETLREQLWLAVPPKRFDKVPIELRNRLDQLIESERAIKQETDSLQHGGQEQIAGNEKKLRALEENANRLEQQKQEENLKLNDHLKAEEERKNREIANLLRAQKAEIDENRNQLEAFEAKIAKLEETLGERVWEIDSLRVHIEHRERTGTGNGTFLIQYMRASTNSYQGAGE